MKINSTDYTYCKVTNVDIVESTAKVSLLFYSSAPQTQPDEYGNVSRAFCFYLRDLDTQEVVRLSNNTYWVDRSNRYIDESNNIDINMYKKVLLNIDISNGNKSEMLKNRWVRRCELLLYNITTGEFDSWKESFALISNEVVLPELSDIRVSKSLDNKISISIDSTYASQADFNYMNKNLKIFFSIRSVYTNLILEETSYTYNELQSKSKETFNISFIKEYSEPILIEVRVTNLKEETLLYKNKFINPEHSLSNLYIKTNHGIKAIVSSSVKTTSGIKPVASLAVKK